MSFCPNCGKKLKNNALFCESCDTVASSDGKIHGKVSDKWIWLLLVVCGFANLLKAFNDTGDILLIIIISSVLTLVFWLVDLRELRAKGHEGLWRLWGLFVMPIYLFVRAARVTKNYTVAIGYLVLFIMLMSVNLGTGEVGNAVLDFFDRSGVGAALDNIVESEYVTMVKNGSLRSCPDHTVNEMVNAFLANPRWEYGVSEDGRKFVNIRGSFSYSGKNVRGVVQFLIEDDSFSFNAFEINDLPQNMFLAMALMEKMCEAASEGGGGTTGKSASVSTNQPTEQISDQSTSGISFEKFKFATSDSVSRDIDISFTCPIAMPDHDVLVELQKNFIKQAFGEKYVGLNPSDVVTHIGRKLAQIDEAESYCLEEYSYSDSVFFPIPGFLHYSGNFYEYTCGAHGNSLFEICLYNLANGKKVEPKDIFINGWELSVTKLIISAYLKKTQKDSWDFADEKNFIPNGNMLLIDPKGITFTYNTYMIAPYAEGIQEVFLSWKELKPYLNTNSVIYPKLNI